MGRGKGSGRGRPKKDPFADLPTEFREKIDDGNDSVIFAEIKDVALYRQSLEEAKKEDADYLAAKDALAVASEPYKEGDKMCKLKIRYARQVLKDRGREVPEVE